jgi:hypothetical protein
MDDPGRGIRYLGNRNTARICPADAMVRLPPAQILISPALSIGRRNIRFYATFLRFKTRHLQIMVVESVRQAVKNEHSKSL